jgi:hypothetical protein
LHRKVVFIALFIALIGIALISVTLIVRKTESDNRVDEAYKDCLKFLMPLECKAQLGE